MAVRVGQKVTKSGLGDLFVKPHAEQAPSGVIEIDEAASRIGDTDHVGRGFKNGRQTVAGRFRLFALGDVAANAQQTDDLPVLIFLWGQGHLHEGRPLQAGVAAQFMNWRLLALQNAMKHFPGQRQVIGMNHGREGLAYPIGARKSRHGLDGGIQRGECAVRRDREDRVSGVVKEAAILLLGLTHQAFRPFAPGDVLFDGDVTGDHTVVVPQRGDRHIFVEEVAVLAAIGQFPAPDLTGGNCLPQVAIERLVLFPAFKEARVLSDNFLRGVAGQGREGGVNRLDRAGVVGNHDGIGNRVRVRS